MKRILTLFSGIFTLLFLTSEVFSQSSATWNLTSNGNAFISGNLIAGTVSTGPGYRSGGISSMSYNSNGVSSTNWIGYSYTQFSITSQYYNQDYYQYTVSPASGNNFTISTVSYEVSASTAPVSWYAYYSLDGFNTYTALGSRNATSHTGLNINIPEGSTFTLRIYGMDLVSTSTAFRNKNVVISGSSTPSCVSQTANAGGNISVCKGETTASLGGHVGGSATSGLWTSNSGGTFTPNATDLNATWTPSSEFTGNATLTLTTTNGCSTPVVSTKTVTVNNTVQFNNPQTICQGGSYSINGNTYTSAGTYTDVLQTQSGCDSTVITTLTVQQETLSDVVTNTQNGTTLVATQEDAVYQWIRCGENNTPVSGATTQSFVPQESGSYAVIITSSTCPSVMVTSRCITINKDNVGIAGTLQVAGLSEFEKKVTMREGLVLEGVATDSIVGIDSTEVSFLFLKGGDGTVKKGGILGLFDMMYAERIDALILIFQCGPTRKMSFIQEHLVVEMLVLEQMHRKAGYML